MATARVFSDLFPKAQVLRLAPFFRAFRDALNRLASGETPEGRVGILTPGQMNDTYFEHAYIARYLGTMLLETGDLTVDKGRLMVRTVAGPQPLDVLWRRIDSRFADPLELDETSQLGTPGLVGALRDGALTMVNALGSGVLEAQAMLAFLPRIAQAWGTPLALPNLATWWCGQPAERAHVLANTRDLMIGPALSTRPPFEHDAPAVLGGTFRGTARGPIADWITHEGASLVGQEAVKLSTTPVYENGRLVPRPMTIRVFVARTPQGWTVMPGGYARVGQTEDPSALAMQAGGSVADVWVVSPNPVVAESLATPPTGPFLRRREGVLPSRAADNLFWLGRYAERAEGAVRALLAYHLRLAEADGFEKPLIAMISDHCQDHGLDVTEPVPQGLRNSLDAAKGCAARTRDRFSTDGWIALRDLAKMAETGAQSGDTSVPTLAALLRQIAGFSGLVHENMFRSNGWRFLTMGRAVERGQTMAGILARFAAPDTPQGCFDIAIELGDCVMTHNRRYSVVTNRDTVVDLLALDNENPRSVLYQLNEIRDFAEKLPRARDMGQISPLLRDALRLETELTVAAPQELDRNRLLDLQSRIGDLSDQITLVYFQ